MSIVVSGRVRFFVEGTERIASPGDVLHLPPHCWHGATMMDEEQVLMDIFTPVREDFLGWIVRPSCPTNFSLSCLVKAIDGEPTTN
ncbi:MAG TPA: hypothetical protein DCK99_14835 [Blastocatellia bacterium]|nr:hypothetical protein [Blastocatellia bacterium]